LLKLKSKSKVVLILGFFCSAVSSSLIDPNPVMASQAGNIGKVNFSAVVVSSFCDIITNLNGALAITKNEKLITSDPTQPGPFTGTPLAAQFSVTSNLDALGAVIVDAPLLIGLTPATTKQVKIGAGAYGNSELINLSTLGSLPPTNVNVRFQTTVGNGKFVNSTYTATATLTCTDDGSK
jgi:hypothetical protein